MFLPRCTPMGMAGTAMGGMMMLACAGPFLAGIGVGAGIVGGSILARKAMERRNRWQDDDSLSASAADVLPDEGLPGGAASP